jgi:predicted metal-dependent peptidase
VADALRRISVARGRLLATLPLLGFLAIKLRPRLAERGEVETASVARDGTLLVNPRFVAGLSDAELCFVLAHEVLHPALLFWDRMGSRDPGLWNLAHDVQINLALAELSSPHFQLVPGCACDERFSGWSAEETYDTIIKEAPPPRLRADTCASAATTVRSKVLAPDPLKGDTRRDLAESDEGRKAARGDCSAARRLATEWRIAASGALQAQNAQGQRPLPDAIRRLVAQALLPPILDWRDVVRTFICEHVRGDQERSPWPSRRSEAVGEHLASLRRSRVPDLVVLVDSSGSIGADRLRVVVSEIDGICSELSVAVRVIVIDESVLVDMEIEDAFELVPRLSGGRGSDFRPAFSRLEAEDQPIMVVAFTDGEIAVPEAQPKCVEALLWVLDELDRKPPTGWGSVLRMPRSPGLTRGPR